LLVELGMFFLEERRKKRGEKSRSIRGAKGGESVSRGPREILPLP